MITNVRFYRSIYNITNGISRLTRNFPLHAYTLFTFSHKNDDSESGIMVLCSVYIRVNTMVEITFLKKMSAHRVQITSRVYFPALTYCALTLENQKCGCESQEY